MTATLRSFGLALSIATAVGLPLAAQETTTEGTTAPATGTEAPAADNGGLSMGEPVADVAKPYVKSEHGDWKLRCVRTADGSDPCEIFQLLKDDKGNPVAEMTMLALPEGGEAAAGSTVVVPLETLLTQLLTMSVDGSTPKRYPFTFCAPVGCFARIGFTGEELEAMKKGSKGLISVVPMAAPDQVVSVNVSFKGFTEAFEALKAELPKKE